MNKENKGKVKSLASRLRNRSQEEKTGSKENRVFRADRSARFPPSQKGGFFQGPRLDGQKEN